jgi:hypothetical protein
MTLLPLSGLRGIAYATGYSLKALRGSSRSPGITAVRWACYAKAYSLGYSLPQIGKFFGKEHTTVLNGIRRHMGMKPKWRADFIPQLETLLMSKNESGHLERLHDQLLREAQLLWKSGCMDTQQIAKRLGVTEASVYNSLCNARGERDAKGRTDVARGQGREVDGVARTGALVRGDR